MGSPSVIFNQRNLRVLGSLGHFVLAHGECRVAQAATPRQILVGVVEHKVVLVSPNPQRHLRQNGRDLRVEPHVDLAVVDRIKGGEKLMVREQNVAAAARIVHLVRQPGDFGVLQISGAVSAGRRVVVVIPGVQGR